MLEYRKIQEDYSDLAECEFVVEDTGEGFQFVKAVMGEGKIRIVLKAEPLLNPET